MDSNTQPFRATDPQAPWESQAPETPPAAELPESPQAYEPAVAVTEVPASGRHGGKPSSGTKQRVLLVLGGMVMGAALVAGGFAIGISHGGSGNTTSLQAQITSLQTEVDGYRSTQVTDETNISQLQQDAIQAAAVDLAFDDNQLGQYDEVCTNPDVSDNGNIVSAQYPCK
jgi:hypothetical protein